MTAPRRPLVRYSTVDEYLRHAFPLIRTLMKRLRAIILETITDVDESIKYSVPFYTRKGLLCYLSPLKTKDGVYIGFAQGHRMSDEAGIFVGQELKQIRHIPYRSVRQIQKRLLQEYLKEAVILNEMHKGIFPG